MYNPLSPRWRKVWADMMGNKLRSLLVILSIALGVFAVGMVATAHTMLVRDMKHNLEQASAADGSLYSDPFPEELLEGLRKVRGADQADGRYNVEIRGRIGGGEWKSFWVTALPDFDKQKVNVVWPVQGDWPPKEGDVLLERTSYASLGAKPGDVLEVETAAGHKRHLRVAGVAYDPSQIPSLFSGRFYGYISMESLEKIEEKRELNQVNYTVKASLRQGKDKKPLEDVGRIIYSKLEKENIMVTWMKVNQPGQHLMQEPLNALLLLMTVLGILALFMSVFLLVNTITAILTQQTRQLGIMKALGATRRQLLAMYLALVAAYGFLSLCIAAPLGAAGAWAVTGFLANLFNFERGSWLIPMPVLLLEAGIALGVPLVAALWPIWRGTARTIREALCDYGIQGERQGRVERGLNYLLYPLRNQSRALILSLRNAFRRKGRLVLTLLTLILAGTIFMAVLSVRASLFSGMYGTMEYYRHDILLQFDRPYASERLMQMALQVPGVMAAEPCGFTRGRILQDGSKQSENKATASVTVQGIDPQSDKIHPSLLSGRWLVPQDQNAVVINTEVWKDYPAVDVGQDVYVQVGEHKLRLKVVGIARGVLEGPWLYMPADWFGQVLQIPAKSRMLQVVVRDKDLQMQKKLARSLEEKMKSEGLRVQRVSTTVETRERIRSQYNILLSFLLLMATLLALVGGLGLMGAIGMNALERTREIGIMRAVGANDWILMKIFISEGLFMGLISWAGAAILSLPVSWLLSNQVGQLFLKSPLPFSFSVGGVILWLVLSALLSVLASFWPAWRASRMPIREVLNYE